MSVRCFVKLLVLMIRTTWSLHKVLKWCNEFSMVASTIKTVYLCISHKNTRQLWVKTGSSSLEQVSNYTYLSVTITSDLSWKTHIENICSSASHKFFFFFKQMLRHSPTSIKLHLFHIYKTQTKIFCVISYGILLLKLSINNQ